MSHPLFQTPTARIVCWKLQGFSELYIFHIKFLKRLKAAKLQKRSELLTVDICEPLRQLQYLSSSVDASCQAALSPKSSQASRLLHGDISANAKPPLAFSHYLLLAYLSAAD